MVKKIIVGLLSAAFVFSFFLSSVSADTSKEDALNKAQSFSDNDYMSKDGLHDQLISDEGEGYSEDLAQYAIDNIDVDWKENALKLAKRYDDQGMSEDDIRAQLGYEKFTNEEAQYAMDKLGGSDSESGDENEDNNDNEGNEDENKDNEGNNDEGENNDQKDNTDDEAVDQDNDNNETDNPVGKNAASQTAKNQYGGEIVNVEIDKDDMLYMVELQNSEEGHISVAVDQYSGDVVDMQKIDSSNNDDNEAYDETRSNDQAAVSDNDNDDGDSNANKGEEKGEQLPNTASNTPLLMAVGGFMVLIGSALLFIRRKFSLGKAK